MGNAECLGEKGAISAAFELAWHLLRGLKFFLHVLFSQLLQQLILALNVDLQIFYGLVLQFEFHAVSLILLK